MILTITIPDIAPTMNKIYSGVHWAVRKKLADIWHEYIKDYCDKGNILSIKEFPVTIITQTRLDHGRMRDTSNCWFPNKLVEDGLVREGIIPDDNPKYVAGSMTWRPVIRHPRKETVVKICTKLSEILQVIKEFENEIEKDNLL